MADNDDHRALLHDWLNWAMHMALLTNFSPASTPKPLRMSFGTVRR